MIRRAAPAAGLALACLAACATVPVGGDPWDTRLADARRNAGTAEGAAFEASVVGALRRTPIRERLRACLAADPAAGQLVGVYVFLGRGNYSLDLRPRGATSDCVTQAIARESLPEPPRSPYAVPFRWPDRL